MAVVLESSNNFKVLQKENKEASEIITKKVRKRPKLNLRSHWDPHDGPPSKWPVVVTLILYM